MPILVQKYGGSSVKDGDRLRAVARRIAESRAAGFDLVVVVSAMGKTTDQLIALAHSVSTKPSSRELDMLLATGEQTSMALLAMALGDLGIPARSLTGWQAGIQTEAYHQAARIEAIDPARIHAALSRGEVVIVAGFQGVSRDGEITTLGRGGSDTTAVALAVALGAERCDIYTDVPGVFTTDPRLVPEARLLSEVTYDEMLELAHLGAGVLHPRSVELAKRFDMPIRVLSSYEDRGGTMIVRTLSNTSGAHAFESNLETGRVVTGVARDQGIARFTLTNLPNRMHILSEVFNLLEKAHINVDIIIQSLRPEETTEIAFTVQEEDAPRVLEALNTSQHPDFQAVRIMYETSLDKVSIVGSGMVSHPGVAAEMFRLLTQAGIEIKMVSTSEIKVSVVVEAKDSVRAVKILHEGFHLDSAEAVHSFEQNG
ncbi:MAG: aspartate kinase [Candidatus Carbobacillus altaicus]|uniref:Aspartokinase n=1 Tax=Candidatus Carbonibacillus altaicus TaxID=2163959 RepID=A0A2R6Y5D8_9BACL|nr:aspartate kinase [Candidatus Carbobacillus altaicus]PTQ57890.1 MAG: Aspartokinase [Candidatus Carbobacillus altaicus]